MQRVVQAVGKCRLASAVWTVDPHRNAFVEPGQPGDGGGELPWEIHSSSLPHEASTIGESTVVS